jgi:Tol biopolymer transport system component
MWGRASAHCLSAMVGGRLARSIAAVAVGSLVAAILVSYWEQEAPASQGPGRLVFVTKNLELAVVNADGTGLRKLTRRLPAIKSPRWSPDGKRIAFVRTDPHAVQASSPVYVIASNGSGQRSVARGYSPRWSPDGRRLVFVDVADSIDKKAEFEFRAGRIVVLDLSSGRRREIARGTAPAWSPDGKQIAFMRYTFTPNGPALDVDTSSLLTVHADGSGLRVIQPPDIFWPLYRPVWSPDGRTIAAFGLDVSNNGENGLRLIDPGTGKARELVKDLADYTEVQWSPDGTKIAFVNAHDAVAVAVVKTGDTRILAQDVGSHLTRWSPNGKQLGFNRCNFDVNPNRCTLYAVNVDGSREQRITQISVDNSDFDWGP